MNIFSHTKCDYYPCHVLPEGEPLNCFYCYCPLYPYEHCGGNYKRLNGLKDCSECIFPHRVANEKRVVEILKILQKGEE